MMSVPKIALFAALFGVATLLQGCGCDSEKSSECLKKMTDANTNCDTFSACFKDNSCCDLEEDGKKASDLIKAMCALVPGTNKCA